MCAGDRRAVEWPEEVVEGFALDPLGKRLTWNYVVELGSAQTANSTHARQNSQDVHLCPSYMVEVLEQYFSSTISRLQTVTHLKARLSSSTPNIAFSASTRATISGGG